MSEHRFDLRWERGKSDFTYETYDRTHHWRFGGGVELDASSAPEYLGRADLPNPEEALVAACSSCHMLSVLAIAARQRFAVESYRDAAVGHLEKNADGKLAITRVELRPSVAFSGDKQPTREQIARMHEQAHKVCFIANSVKSEVSVVPAD
jgi:organic hydroperoxide reductase OsmC/OhrA